MISQQPDIPGNGVDAGVLSTLIIELNIARHNFKSYPNGHPVIGASFRKVITLYNQLLQLKDEIVIGVARDTLMVEAALLDKSNLVYRDFALVLFERGIGALILKQGLTLEELRKLYVVLGLKRNEISRHGGIEAVWEKSGISSLRIRAINYDLFSTSEEDKIANHEGKQPNEGLWNRFTRGLVEGTLGPGDNAAADMDPELLATIVNKQFHATDNDNATDQIEAIIDFIRKEESVPLTGQRTNIPYDKLAVFVEKLDPSLRRHFLTSTFDIQKLNGNPITEDIVSRMSTDSILHILKDMNRQNIKIPANIMKLMRKLAMHPSRNVDVIDDLTIAESELRNKMNSIFQEHPSEEFVPPAYQQKLNQMIEALNIPLLKREELGELLLTLESHQVENRIGAIIMNLASSNIDPAECDTLARTLSEMSTLLLQTGDYDQFLSILDQAQDAALPERFRQRLLELCLSNENLEEILNGLSIWGKPRFENIKKLIARIGDPFVKPLLDHLATEENISLRRFIMDRLSEFGSATKKAVVERMQDERWYFLRNLLIMLRQLNDPDTIAVIRPLVRHSNAKVRQEAMRTLLHLQDPASERQLVRDLESDNQDNKIAAIHLAEKSSSAEVFRKLVTIAVEGGLSQMESEVRSAAIQALGEIGRVEAIPELAKILGSRSLIHSKTLSRLKLDIVRSLEHYPPQAAHSFLEKLSSGTDELAQRAAESLSNLKATHHER